MPRAERSSGRTAGESTRSRILAAAAALFAEHGYAGTSVRMVARSLGLTDPAIHYHFASKQSLYLALLSQPDYGALPLDSASLSRESVIDQVTHLFAWWVERPEFGQMLLREQLASEDASVAYLTTADDAWDEHVSGPLQALFGRDGAEVAEMIADMVSGLYWEAILSYGDKTREIASQPYFQERLHSMLQMAVPVQQVPA